MYFNEELNKDIEKLKELRRLHLTRDYHVYRAEVMKKHNISLTTVLRHMDKPAPGLTMSNPDTGKQKSGDELTAETNPQPKPAPAMHIKGFEHLNGEPLSGERLGDGPLSEKAHKKFRKELIEKMRDMELYLDRRKINQFSDLIQNFFRDLFAYAYEGLWKKGGLYCRIPKEEFVIADDYIEDICLVMANAYAYYKVSNLEISRDEYIKMRLRNLFEQQLRRTGERWLDVKDVEAFTRMFKRMEPKQENIAVNLNFVQIICNELKPGITKDEIIAIFRKKLPNIASNFT
ncbi:MAG: hypothetical protein L0Y79_00065 [Chlorobi bacterium]|nr:hypothetical protein [Chlorobiota bacterium]MCI0716526.1 hypothetical protein [Chlorobiota bacterium]